MAVKIRRFVASVSQGVAGGGQPEEFPVHAEDYATASRLAFSYVLKVLRLKEFELRIIGS